VGCSVFAPLWWNRGMNNITISHRGNSLWIVTTHRKLIRYTKKKWLQLPSVPAWKLTLSFWGQNGKIFFSVFCLFTVRSCIAWLNMPLFFYSILSVMVVFSTFSSNLHIIVHLLNMVQMLGYVLIQISNLLDTGCNPCPLNFHKFMILSIKRNPFSAQNQTLRSCRVYISPTK